MVPPRITNTKIIFCTIPSTIDTSIIDECDYHVMHTYAEILHRKYENYFEARECVYG